MRRKTTPGAKGHMRERLVSCKNASGASWDPSELTNLELWLKPESLPAVSSTVATWTDSSGNGRDFTQGTEASKPVVVSGLDGNKGAQFDKVDDNLTSGSAYDGSQILYIVTAVGASPTSYGRIFSASKVPGGDDYQEGFVFAVDADSAQYLAGAGNRFSENIGTVDTNYHAFRLIISDATGGSTFRQDNGTPVAFDTFAFASVIDTYGINTFLRTGGPTSPHAGQTCCEVLIINGTDTSDDSNIMSYFAAKYPSLGL